MYDSGVIWARWKTPNSAPYHFYPWLHVAWFQSLIQRRAGSAWLKYWSRNAVRDNFDDGPGNRGASGNGEANVAAEDTPRLLVFGGTEAAEGPEQHMGVATNNLTEATEAPAN